MALSERRSVITGLGVLSTIGSDPAAFLRNLLDGKTGVKGISHIDPAAVPVQAVARIDDFDAKKLLHKQHRKSLNVMARTVQLGVCAAQLAMQDTGFGESHTLDPDRFGIEFGCSMVASDLDDIARASKLSTVGDPAHLDYGIWGEKGLAEIPPLWMLKYLPNMPAGHTSIIHNARGPNNSLTASDVASLQALGEAYRIIERDAADFFLVGGTESKMNALSISRHCTFQELTRARGVAGKLLRPFAADRAGTVLGEGAAVLCLEEAEHAKKRNAKIYGEIVGFASGCDPNRQGPILSKVIEKALKDAKVTLGDIDHVNAQAGGMKLGDPFEARGIAAVFGKNTPVVAYKPNVGYSGAAGGLLELAASLLAVRTGELPPTLNCENQGADCPVWVHKDGVRKIQKPHFVKISATDMGTVAVAVIRGM